MVLRKKDSSEVPSEDIEAATGKQPGVEGLGLCPSSRLCWGLSPGQLYFLPLLCFFLTFIWEYFRVLLSLFFNYVYVYASTCEHIHISVRRSPVARVIDSCELSDVGFENSSARAVHAESFLQPPTRVCVCTCKSMHVEVRGQPLRVTSLLPPCESYISPLSYLSSPRAASFVGLG